MRSRTPHFSLFTMLRTKFIRRNTKIIIGTTIRIKSTKTSLFIVMTLDRTTIRTCSIFYKSWNTEILTNLVVMSCVIMTIMAMCMIMSFVVMIVVMIMIVVMFVSFMVMSFMVFVIMISVIMSMSFMVFSMIMSFMIFVWSWAKNFLL